jgi:hypothetical protein
MKSQALVENVIHLDKENRARKARSDDLQGGRPQSIDERRQIADIHEQFSPVFEGLEVVAPAPLNGESPFTFRRRILGELAGEVDRANRRRAAAEGRADLTEDERRMSGWARNSRIYDWDSTTAFNFGAEIVGAAERLAADPLQGRFDGSPGLRKVTRVVNGHTFNDFHGDNMSWLAPFMHPAQCVVDMMDPRKALMFNGGDMRFGPPRR